MTDTISAISTAPVASGVAVIRLSGSDSLNVAKKMFRPVGNVGVENFEPRKMYLGEIDCDGFSDMGLMVYFAAPNSFTGEDVVEFHSHGGVAITRGILRNTVKHGARLAVGGEFTKRAFMNGKLSLSSAEGLIEMINGESVAQAKAGYSLYREKLTKEVNSLQDMLTDALSEIDADMDFPEEDLEIAAHEKVKEALKGTDAAAIKAESEELTKRFYALSEKLYKQTGAAPDGTAPNDGAQAAGPDENGYYDANYEVKDDGSNK